MCGSPNIHRHHIIYGTGKRALSEKYGCWVYLCPTHHTLGASAVHRCKGIDAWLKDKCQRAFEKEYPELNWMDIFHKNYKKEG